MPVFPISARTVYGSVCNLGHKLLTSDWSWIRANIINLCNCIERYFSHQTSKRSLIRQEARTTIEVAMTTTFHLIDKTRRS